MERQKTFHIKFSNFTEDYQMSAQNETNATNATNNAAPAFSFKRGKSHTIPFFSAQTEGESIYVKVTGEMRESDYIPDGQKDKMIIAPAIDLSTGEQVNLIVGAILNKIFTADKAYVGKSYEIQNQGSAGRGARAGAPARARRRNRRDEAAPGHGRAAPARRRRRGGAAAHGAAGLRLSLRTCR
jgi:hypothetical protein